MYQEASEKDFEFFYSLYMHPQVNPFLLYEMMDRESFWPIFRDLLLQTRLYVFWEEGKAIGMFKLEPSKHRLAHLVYLGGLAIHPDFGGMGYGLKMLEEIIELCKNEGFLRIELSVGIINEKAKNLYQKAGFVQEGILRKYTYLKSKDIFIDEILMSYLVE